MKKAKTNRKIKTASSGVGNDEGRYVEIVLEPVRVCAHYKPKFGQGQNAGGLTLAQFQNLYRNDRFYGWFGLDNPLMYAAHKAAGGMTSIYRQVGIGCEKLFRTILKDALCLSEEEVSWSYEVPTVGGKSRTLTLDGRVTLNEVADEVKRKRLNEWMRASAAAVGVDANVFSALKGVVFEVRQGYKSKDSKRQNADIANAATAYAKGYLPCAIILSAQIDSGILARYRAERWVVLTGIGSASDVSVSTYDFMMDIVGYDLAGFFSRNSEALRTEIDAVLKALLAPDLGP